MSVQRLRLRIPTEADVVLLDAWDATPEQRGEFNDFGLPPSSHAQTAAEDKFVDANHGTLLIERIDDGTPIGTVSWRPSMYGPGEQSRAWQLGISLPPESRGQGYGGEALRLVTEYLFESTNANRIEAQTDVENLPSMRALAKAGFVKEGVARGAQFRAGRLHDLAIYARLRGEAAPG